MIQFSAAPWRVLDKEHLQLCVDAAKLHVRFAEKIEALARAAATTGEPIVRPLTYVFPDCGYEAVKDQFLLGDDVLAAPMVVKGDRKKTVHFPPGRWKGDDGSVVDGPCVRDVDAPLNRLPWFERVA